MSYALDVERLVKVVFRCSERESRFLTPDPQRIVDIYTVFDELNEQGVSAEDLDRWLGEVQDEKKL